MSRQTENPFTNRVRVRVCGLLIQEGKVLLLKHDTIGSSGYLWSPPGGGVEFGESAHETLIKEFKEETNLTIEVGEYLFTNEFIGTKHHAIELFFHVHLVSGDLKLGFDPELPLDKQILTEARFI
ncbi:MAG: NUDIX hydrolase, partial [Bacteroidota bacterium]